MGVDVYFNLHRKVWSLRCRKSGLVTGHARVVAFPLGASMVVRPAGRAKVLETGQKNVHAFVRGAYPETSDDWASWDGFGHSLPEACRITYNPRTAGHFTRRDTGERIDAASAVVMVARPDFPPEVWAIPKNSA
ncbi:hypothetical protein MAL1_00006 [Bacteriophage DSS3_MAL1]|nr:hypothetical protein MAL1_00006 [Bacteriophage DSS3_MAL1]